MEKKRFTVYENHDGSEFTLHDDQVAYLVIDTFKTREEAEKIAAKLNKIDPIVCSIEYASTEAMGLLGFKIGRSY